ncbi:Transcriptional regulator, TetR family [Streptomyces sp. YIM 130001]|uniref:TetR/AcrR family transcriptional regulator n=1 Tax=Streptomyces sp. YIM 130001 TaxID=2259644 RepID=UPI000E64996F|nr:TetR/AcrR family transcriptional regulator [Streptomyces sp. YIM 130001]RII17068.1 Transcriptional regulator, TetR family [Streptomyces sp. YIM 130001]
MGLGERSGGAHERRAGTRGAAAGAAAGAEAGARVARGRPRSEAVERAIFEGVLTVLEEGVPLAALSIERIARTAGVGKATIYRRWSGKEELLVEVLAAMEDPGPELAGIDVRDDLVALVEGIRQRGLAKRNSALLSNLVAQAKTFPKLWDLYHRNVVAERAAQMRDVLRRGVESGEIRGDLDPELMGLLITGPMLTRTILHSDDPLPEGLSETVVDAVLSGLRPADGEPGASGR